MKDSQELQNVVWLCCASVTAAQARHVANEAYYEMAWMTRIDKDDMAELSRLHRDAVTALSRFEKACSRIADKYIEKEGSE